MSKSTRKHKTRRQTGSKVKSKVNETAKIESVCITEVPKGVPSSWEPFEQYNRADPIKRRDMLTGLGISVKDEEILGALTKSHFVIPGKTRFQCQTCGECCRYARKLSTLSYEPCHYLNKDNLCTKHDDRYIVCKWFPFWIYKDEKLGYILTIKPYCTGYGKGELVDYEKVLKNLLDLRQSSIQDPDGAFVIHEVIYLPTQKRWVFPSRKNIDELMNYIADQAKTGINPNAPSHISYKHKEIGELEHARKYTCGLLCRDDAPSLTVNDDGIVTDVNQALCLLSGKDRESIVGKNMGRLFVNQESISHDILTCFSRGKLTASPHRLHRSIDTSLPVLLNAAIYRDREDGLIHGAMVCVSEISPEVYKELMQSRNYARGLLDASIDYFVAMDREGIITDVNTASLKVSGCSREELLNTRFSDHFVDSERAQRGVERTVQNGFVKDYELELKTKNGRIIPVSFNANVFKDMDGEFQGLFASARDISDMKKMIKRLEEAHNYARGLIESSLDLMVTINSEGIITDVNETAVQMTGALRNQLIGSSFSKYFTDGKKAEQGVEKAFAEGKVVNFRLELLSADREIIPITFNANEYRDTRGNVQGIFAVARKCMNEML